MKLLMDALKVVVVVYLTTNQCHLGYLSSVMGTWLEDTVPNRFKTAMPLAVQGRPVIISQNIAPFCSVIPYSPHFGTLVLKLQRH